MRIPLKGLHKVRKKLADGTVAIYYYAWRGGPRLEGQPGSPEFHTAFRDVTSGMTAKRSTGTLEDILDAFQNSDAFLSLAPRTRQDYRKLLRAISNEFGDFPLAALTDRKARGIFLQWRDGLAKRSRRQADYAWSVLARTLSWAVDRGLADANPCEKGGKLYHGSRGDQIWSEEKEAAFMRVASEPLRLAMTLALWTGQRQGDLLRLPWSAYDGQTIRLKQGKTGARVAIPVGAPLKAMLEATKKHGPLILMNTRGRAWTTNGFHASWRKACAAVTRSQVSPFFGLTRSRVNTAFSHVLRDLSSKIMRSAGTPSESQSLFALIASAHLSADPPEKTRRAAG
jgi:integrase